MLRSATTLLNTPVLEIIQLFFSKLSIYEEPFACFHTPVMSNYKIVLCAKSEYIGRQTPDGTRLVPCVSKYSTQTNV